MTRFEIFKRHNLRFYYRVIAETGHNILSSEGYENKTGCQEAILSVKNKISKKEELLIEKTDSETWKFIVKGDQNWLDGYSMSFQSVKQ
ncbi:MAG: DUF1508 domain-containing protein [Chitinophagaceae bacterium]|nr:DUF1508 domain-containing protein [Chitinophagaceae bacterium]